MAHFKITETQKESKKITAVHKTAALKHFHSLNESNYAEPLKYFPFFLPCAKKNIGWDCSLTQRGIFSTIGKWEKERRDARERKKENSKSQNP